MEGIASSNINIGGILIIQKKYNEAIACLNKALNLTSKIGDVEGIRDANGSLSEAYTALKKHDLALTYYKNYIIARDSMINSDASRKTTELQMNYEFEKRETATKTQQEKKDAVAKAESRKQKQVLILISCVLVLVLIFAVFAYRSYLSKQRANVEINLQKKVIEEKQKEILDSIHYAKRIQSALLPNEKYINKNIIRLLKK